MADATKVITGTCRLSFVHLLAPYSQDEDSEPKYSCVLLIPKTDKATIRKIRAAQEAAKEIGKAKYWKGKIPRDLYDTLRDGDDEDADLGPEYKGHWFMNVSAKRKPGIIDRNREPLTDESDIYSGVYARVSMGAFPYSAKGNNGVSFGLNNVQKVKDGESLAGFTRAEDDFDDDFDDFDDDDDNDLI